MVYVQVFVGWETETSCYQKQLPYYGYINTKSTWNWTIYCSIELMESI